MVGVDGVVPFLQQCLLEPEFMLGTLVVCFSAVQVMFELRTLEQTQSAAARSTSLCLHASSHEANVSAGSPAKL